MRQPWAVRHRRTILVALLLLATCTRAAAWLQVRSTPLAQMDQWRQTDMHYYRQWARAISAGDWASAALPLPMHRWHHDVAARYWAAHPGEQATLAAARRDPDEALWARWMRTPRFYQDPLYAYLLAAAERAGGDAATALILLQLAAGVVSIVLIWSLTRQFFGDVAAAVAGTGAVLYAPFVFYELMLVRDSLIACAGLAIVWLFERARHRAPGWSVLLGVAVGGACLLKSTFLVLGAGLLAWMAAQAIRERRRTRILRAAAFVAGCALATSPAIARNIIVHTAPVALASSGPMTFVAANAPTALPDVGFGIDADALASFLGSTDGGWRAAWRATIGSRSVPDLLALQWRKWDRLWHWFEIPNNENFYYARLQVPVLAVLPVTFAVCGPLAALGVILVLARRRDAWPLLLLAVAALAPLLLFYVLGRFRVAFAAAVLPFAAFAVVEIAAAARAGKYRRLAALAAAVAVIALWIDRPLARDQVLIRTADWILPWSVEFESRVYGALDAKDPGRAADAYLEFFRRAPTDAQIVAGGDPRLAAELADMHAECAQILKAAGRPREAEAQLLAARHVLDLPIGK